MILLDLAIATALYQCTTILASSIGAAIAGAVWNSWLPRELARIVPGEINYAYAIGDINYVLSLPKEQYDAVATGYGNILRIFCIVGLCLSVLALVFALLMKSFDLEDDKVDVLSETTVIPGDGISEKSREHVKDQGMNIISTL